MRRDHRHRVRPRLAIALPVIGGLASGLASVVPAWGQSSADQWASAIREQKEAIASNRAQRARCAPAEDPRCVALAQRGKLMDDNLRRLERHYARLTGAPAPSARASSGVTLNGRPVQAAQRGQGEIPPGVTFRTAETRPAPQQQRGFFSFLFGGNDTTQARSGVTIDGEPLDELPQGGLGEGDGYGAWSGNYRTLCVRTCDGYFFPVSFNSSRGRLKTDASVCKALCPQAETRLYYHDAAGQEAEDAVAADDGTPLVKMTNAFLYRTKVVEGCTCGTPDPRTLPVQAGGLAGIREARLGDPGGLPVPRPRPDPDQDPATQAVQLSGLSTEPVAPLTPLSPETEARIAAAAPSTPPKVRTVGPKWLSDR